MSYNGSGVYTLPGAQLVNGEIVSATENNQFRNDVATALNTAWTRDGQSTATGNIPMGTHKFTGLAAGTSNGDSVRYEQLPSSSNPLAVNSGGTGSTTGAAALVALGNRTGATGSEILPAGTTAQRDGSPAAGYTRFNTDTGAEEYYNGTAWVTVADSATSVTLTGTQTLTNKTLTSPVINGTGVNFSDGSIQNTAATGFGFKNRIINGAMMIDQRNAGAAKTTNGYSVDRWQVGSISGGTFSVQQVTDAPTGFVKSLQYSVTGTTTANDYNQLVQPIEANNVTDLAWGTSSGQTATLSFWAKSNNTGQVNGIVTFIGGSATYYYYPTYTITAANTWQYVTLTIPAPPSAAGAFANALNTVAINVAPIAICSSGGSTTTGNTWSTTSVGKATGSINLASTSSATLYITGVQLEKGSTATSFDYLPYGTELALCMRYAVGYSSEPWTYALNGSAMYTYVRQLPVPMRTAPSIQSGASYSVSTGSAGTVSLNTATTNSISITNGSSNWTAGAAVSFTGVLTSEL